MHHYFCKYTSFYAHIADCPVIARIKNGSVTYDTYHGAIANVSCVPGYFLKGTGMSTCIDGTWTPAIATCEGDLN